ncbi:MAG TPA: hypothetical protein VNA28_03215 [Solirubrobacteraceae bacterium]|nr:hypothetical protein [Solirubrobacteraceae bacterium]
MTRTAIGLAWALMVCGLMLVLAGPAHAVATVAADTTRASGLNPQTAGRNTSLTAGNGNETLLRFRVQGLGGAPARAVLRLRVTDPTTGSLAVRAFPSAFAEDEATAAQPGPTVIATLSNPGVGTWAEWDVSAAVPADGDVGLQIRGPEGLFANPASFSSREGPDAPQLVVTPDDDRGARLAGLLDPRTAETFVPGARDNLGNSLDCLDVIAAPPGLGIPGLYIGVYHTLINNVFVSKVATSNNLTTWTHRADLDTHASQPTLASTPDGGFLLGLERDVQVPVAGNNLVVRHYATWAALLDGTHREVSLPRSLAPTAEGTPALEVTRWNGPDDSQIDITFHYFKDLFVDRQAAGQLTNFDPASWAPQIDTAVNDLFVGLGTRGNLGDRADLLFEGHSFAVLEAQSVRTVFGTWRWYLYDRERQEARLLPITLPAGAFALGNPTVRALRDAAGSPLLLVSGFSFGPGESGQFIALRHATTDPPPPPQPIVPPLVPLSTAAVAPTPPARAVPAPPAVRVLDTTPPVIRISSRAQKLRRSVAATVACIDEACRVTTTGTVRVPRVGRAAARTYTLNTVTTTIASGGAAFVRLDLGRKTRAAIRRALRAKKRIIVTMRMRIADSAGNAQTHIRQVRLTL